MSSLLKSIRNPKLAILLAGLYLLYGMIVSLWWQPSFNRVEVEIESLENADIMQIYYRYDRSGMRSYHEYLSAREYVHSAREPLVVSFSLPGGNDLLGLRFDPAKKDNQLVLRTIRFSLRNLWGTHTLREIRGADLPSLWEPNEMVLETKVMGDHLWVETKASDPFFLFTEEFITSDPPLASGEVWYLRGQRAATYFLGALALFFLCRLFQSAWVVRCANGDSTVWNRAFPLLFLGLITLLAVVVYYPFLVFEKLYLYADAANDTIDAFWPGFMHISEIFRSEGWPLWSFSVGVGKSIFGWVGDPFLLMIYMLPPENLAFGLGWIQFLKVVTAGCLFFAYFRLLGLGKCAATVTALGLAFSAHMVVRGNWYHYATEVVMVAFALFAFECYLKKRIWQLLPLAISFLVLRGVFHTYVWSQMFLAYALLRLWMDNGFRFSLFRDAVWKMGLLYLMGIGFTAIILFPNAYELFTSTRVSGHESGITAYATTPLFALNTPKEWLSAFYGLFSPDLLGRGRFYSGWQNYLEGPHLYAGILVLLLVPQVFFQRSARTRIAVLVVFSLIAAYMLFPYVRYYLNGFSGNYFKTSSFWISVALAGMAGLALDNLVRKRVLNIWILLASTIFYLWALSQLTTSDFVIRRVTVAEGFPLLEQVHFLLIAYTVVLLTLRWNLLRPVAITALVGLVAWEVSTFSTGTVQDREILRGDTVRTGGLYFDDSYDAASLVREMDDGFYRMEKDVVSVHLNDALGQNYRGFRSYHSFNSSAYFDFLAHEGFDINFWHRGFGSAYIAGFRGRFIPETILSNKYYLVVDPDNDPPPDYQLVDSVGQVRIYENPHFLPFGYLYTHSAAAEQVRTLQPVEARDLIALQAAILSETERRKLTHLVPLKEEAYEQAITLAKNPESEAFLDFYRNQTSHLRQNHLQITSFDNNHFMGTIEVEEPSLLFLSIPYDKGWNVRVNDGKRPIMRTHFGFSGVYLHPGEKRISITYFPPMMKAGAVVTGFSLLLAILFLCRPSFSRRFFTLHREEKDSS